jgi:hypothetical protein
VQFWFISFHRVKILQSHLRMFGSMNETLRGRFSSDEEVTGAVQNCERRKQKIFFLVIKSCETLESLSWNWEGLRSKEIISFISVYLNKCPFFEKSLYFLNYPRSKLDDDSENVIDRLFTSVHYF